MDIDDQVFYTMMGDYHYEMCDYYWHLYDTIWRLQSSCPYCLVIDNVSYHEKKYKEYDEYVI